MPATRLEAQITEVARTPIADAAPLTFGYLCDGKVIAKSIKDKRSWSPRSK